MWLMRWQVLILAFGTSCAPSPEKQPYFDATVSPSEWSAVSGSSAPASDLLIKWWAAKELSDRQLYFARYDVIRPEGKEWQQQLGLPLQLRCGVNPLRWVPNRDVLARGLWFQCPYPGEFWGAAGAVHGGELRVRVDDLQSRRLRVLAMWEGGERK